MYMNINEIQIMENIQKLNVTKLMILFSKPFNTIGFSITIISLYMYEVLSLDDILFIYSGSLMSLIIKLSFKRERPYNTNKNIRNLSGKTHVTILNKYSFPSGHTFVATIFALIMLEKFPKEFVFNLIPVFVGFSRIFLGVHYPSDIISGMLFGFIYYNLLK